jgi:polyisoprenoid-binding protein YceI
VAGDLTIHGVTQQVAFVVDGVTPEAKDPWGGFRRGASASLTINRKDYGLVWNAPLEAGGWMIGEEVHITLDIELVRQPS